jgi:ABC-type transporter lipoprotein component MlaA
MTQDIQHESAAEKFLEEEYVNAAQCHVLAAQHFQSAARQHHEAAAAYESGNLYETHRRAYLAYRHQLLAMQYSEMAALEEEDEDELMEDDEPSSGQA